MNPIGAVHSLVLWADVLSTADANAEPEAQDNRLSPKTSAPEFVPRMLSHYALQLAKLGGYLARKNDPPLGNTVILRGLTRLIDIVLGMQLAAETLKKQN